MNPSATVPTIAPSDEANRRTIASGHPLDWQPPQPKPLYDLVVLGGGPAGTMAVLTAAKAGHTVAVVERNLTGGTCVNFGCTPSKALIRAARAVFQARDGEKFGYRLPGEPQIDFAAVMTRVHEMRAEASAHDSVALMATAGADFYLGEARFVGPDTVEVDGQRLKFKKAVLATGSGPAVPDLPGLAAASYLTNETLFELTELPRRLVCLGGGTINCELAQAFCRLGSQVELVGSADRLLPSEVPEASELIAKQLRHEGVKLHLGVRATRVDGQRKRITLSDGRELEYDALLIAAGRRARVDGIGLEAAGVKFNPGGVETDEHLRTTNPLIYAVGDVAMPEKFTHTAIATGPLAVENALGIAARSAADLVIPRCTYTEPEVAHVGLTPAQAAGRSMTVATHRMEMSEVERARLDGETEGFAALYTHEGVIVGATLVSSHAGESISMLTAAVMQKMTPSALAAVIHCYPTQALVIPTLASQAAQDLK